MIIPPAHISYLHGKLHGIVAKSFLDQRFTILMGLANLSDVYNTLFPNNPLDIPAKELVHSIERAIEKKNLAIYRRVLDRFPEPPRLLLTAFRRFEVRNVKSILRSLRTGAPMGDLWDLGRYGSLKGIGPDLRQTLTGTPYEVHLNRMQTKPLWEVEFALDEEYYRSLLDSVGDLTAREKRLLYPTFLAELRLINLLWVLRLRYYYRMGEEEARDHIFLKDKVPLGDEGDTIFRLSWDEPSGWKSWKYGWMVQIPSDGPVDPSPASWRVAKRLYTLYRRLFYRHPLTLSSIYGFFRMKEHEVRLIHSLTEGLQMEVPREELKEFVEKL